MTFEQQTLMQNVASGRPLLAASFPQLDSGVMADQADLTHPTIVAGGSPYSAYQAKGLPRRQVSQPPEAGMQPMNICCDLQQLGNNEAGEGEERYLYTHKLAHSICNDFDVAVGSADY